jgi:hypothetical protein
MTEFVGLDVSKDTTAICVKDAKGRVLAEMSVETCPQAIFEALRAHCECPESIVLETARAGKTGAAGRAGRRASGSCGDEAAAQQD